MSTELTDENFQNFYKLCRLKENLKNPFTTAIFKKKCLLLTLAQSSKSVDNATACHIFEDQLQEYFRLVDDRTGINNFAKATLELMSNVKNVSKSWTSGLDVNDGPNISDLKPLSGECFNQNDGAHCNNTLPPSSLIPRLLGPSDVCDIKSFPKSIVQTTLDGYKSNSVQGNQFQEKEPERKSNIYSSSSFPDFKKTVNKRNLEDDNMKKSICFPQKIDNGKIKNLSLCSSYSNSSNRTKVLDASENYSKQRLSVNSKQRKSNSLYSDYADSNQDELSEKYRTYHQPPDGKGYRNNKPLFGSTSSYDNINQEGDGQSNKTEFAVFKTAGQQLKISNQKKFGNRNGGRADYDRSYNCDAERSSGFQPQAIIRKSLGGKRTVTSRFVPPVRNNSQEEDNSQKENISAGAEEEVDERLKNIEPRMIEMIKNEIMDTGSNIDWDDIAGLKFAKDTIQEIVVWPMLRPDIFTGLRRPPKGILLFGPPGTGKTLIGKCIASQSNSTFFSISASSLTSKWIGDGEKMVRALFAVARCHQPAVVFIDEIDSLLSQRSDTEHESSRRIKTEFLVQLDGAATGEEDRILVIGATNRPQELDEAARRRLVKRLYIPLPDKEARKQLTQNLMKLERNDLRPEDVEEISILTDGYSGADMKNLCQEASLGPIRSISSKDMFEISAEQVRPVNVSDFKMALKRVKSSVSPQDLDIYLKWDQQYGSGSFLT